MVQSVIRDWLNECSFLCLLPRTTYNRNFPNAQSESTLKNDDISPINGASNCYVNSGQAAQFVTTATPTNLALSRNPTTATLVTGTENRSFGEKTMKKINLDIKFAQLSQTLSLSWRTMAEDNGDVKDFKFLPPCGNLYVL